MDIKGLRTLNLIGTILFGIFSILLPIIYLPILFFISTIENNQFTFVCMSIIICWIIFIIYLVYQLYKNTVLGLDLGNFEAAKRWTLYGALMGLFLGGGLLTLIVFLISYASFDEAIRPKYYYPPPGYYPYQQPPGYGPPNPQPPGYGPPNPQYPRQRPQAPVSSGECPSCRRPVQANWKYCPTCYTNLH